MIIIPAALAVVIIYVLFLSPRITLTGSYPFRVKTDKKIIALTFDDGPNEPYTSEVLDILKKEKVRATFFLIGDCIRRYPDAPPRILSEGHVLGNHSKTHLFRTYLKSGAFQREAAETQQIIKNNCGVEPRLARTPWLWRTPFLLRGLERLGLSPVSGLFCHPFEVFGANSKQIAKSAINKAKPGLILIFHDGKEGRGGNRMQTVESLPIVIKELKKRGYIFVTADELLGLDPYK